MRISFPGAGKSLAALIAAGLMATLVGVQTSNASHSVSTVTKDHSLSADADAFCREDNSNQSTGGLAWMISSGQEGDRERIYGTAVASLD